MHKTDVIIIGAGASGLMCAWQALKRGRSVTILEHQEKAGKKIRISGGGRANFTNLYSTAENFISQNPHFCRSALSKYTPYDFIDLVVEEGIAYHEREEGQLFCDESAQQITDMFLKKIKKLGGKLHFGVEVKSVSKPKQDFLIKTNTQIYACYSLVIATGGLSIPKMGATNLGHKLAMQFGHSIIEPQPALVPFTLNPTQKELFSTLSGISFLATIGCNGMAFKNKLLFTHRGISGPAVLQISSYWQAGDSITINLLPEVDLASELENTDTTMYTDALLSRFLPKRFVKVWGRAYFPPRRLNQLNKKEKESFIQLVHNWQIVPGGTEGYRTAEATRGGVNTKEVSQKTMASNLEKDLYFIGEVLDVTGQLGGHNFQWAWASGFAAGQVV